MHTWLKLPATTTSLPTTAVATTDECAQGRPQDGFADALGVMRAGVWETVPGSVAKVAPPAIAARAAGPLPPVIQVASSPQAASTAQSRGNALITREALNLLLPPVSRTVWYEK